MSMEFLNLAFNANIKGASKAVLIALADRANRGGYCFMSLADIAFRAGCDRRTVMRSISTLEALKHIAVIRDKGLTNHYMILQPDTAGTGDNLSHTAADEQGYFDQNLSTTSGTVSPEKLIHTGDTVSKTSDILSKTSDMSSPKPNITQLTQKPRARGVAQNPPKLPDRHRHEKTQTGLAGLRSIKAIFSGMPTPTPPPGKAAAQTSIEPTQTTHHA
jgi:hypothetical protein